MNPAESILSVGENRSGCAPEFTGAKPLRFNLSCQFHFSKKFFKSTNIMKSTPIKTLLPTALLALTPFTASGHDFALIPKMSGGKLAAVEGRYGHPGSW
jgi:hypothetical protein